MTFAPCTHCLESPLLDLPGKNAAFRLTRTPGKPICSIDNVSLADLSLRVGNWLFLLVYFMCVGVWPECISKRPPDPLELELQTVVSCYMGAGKISQLL